MPHLLQGPSNCLARRRRLFLHAEMRPGVNVCGAFRAPILISSDLMLTQL